MNGERWWGEAAGRPVSSTSLAWIIDTQRREAGRVACREARVMEFRRAVAAAFSVGMITAWPAIAAEGDCTLSGLLKSVPAARVESQAETHYRDALARAKASRALAPDDHPQVKRLRFMMTRLLPFAAACNPRAADWAWEINLLGSRQINATALPGGKLLVTYAALSEAQLTDDEAALMLAHVMAHSILEHTRKNMVLQAVGSEALRQGALVLGVDQNLAAAAGAARLQDASVLQADEAEADRLAVMLAARAGYAPDAARTGWSRLRQQAGDGAQPMSLSHPWSAQLTRTLDAVIEGARPVYDAAAKPAQLFGAPPRLPPTPRMPVASAPAASAAP